MLPVVIALHSERLYIMLFRVRTTHSLQMCILGGWALTEFFDTHTSIFATFSPREGDEKMSVLDLVQLLEPIVSCTILGKPNIGSYKK